MDFLKYKISVKEPYKVRANIPFNITADIMKKVFEDDNPPEDIYFIMQYEAFIRYSGQPFYNESLRSLLYKPWFSAELIYELNHQIFILCQMHEYVLLTFKEKHQQMLRMRQTIEIFYHIYF